MGKDKKDRKAKRLREFTIERSRWDRGEDSEGTLRTDLVAGKLCCLGFMAEACGVPKYDTWGRNYPCTKDDGCTARVREMVPAGLRRQFVNLARTNDNGDISDARREANVKKVFAAHGVRVRFVD